MLYGGWIATLCRDLGIGECMCNIGADDSRGRWLTALVTRPYVQLLACELRLTMQAWAPIWLRPS